MASRCALSAKQLSGEALEGIQIKDPSLAGIFDMSAMEVANYTSVLERFA